MVINSTDLSIESDGITIQGSFYPSSALTGASFTKEGIEVKNLIGAIVMGIVAFYAFKIASFFGWCFVIGAAGLAVSALMPLVSKTFFLHILVKNGEGFSIVSYDEEWTINTVNRINDVAAK